LKGHCYFKYIPLVVYTSVVQRAQVQKILGLRIQNFLRKPYVDETIFKETLKACELAWRELLFTEADETGATPGQSSIQLKAARSALAVALETNLSLIRTTDPVPAQLRKIILDLTAEAEAAGALAIQSNLRELLISSEHPSALFVENLKADLAYAGRILRDHLNPAQDNAAEPTLDPEAVRDGLEYSKWSEADVSKGPLVTAEAVAEKLAALKGCPVIDTIAASFEMTARKSSANLTQLIEMVGNDAGLAATALGAAGKLGHHNEVIEDPALAVSLLGALRLVAIARDNPKIEEHFMNVAPMNWENFWTFQVGVSRFAAFACEQLEFKELAPIARVAGLLHNIGRLITIKLFLHAIPTLMQYAVDQKVTFAAAERAYLGVTSRELGLRFAEAWELSNRICNVLAWLDTPDRAPEDESLVAIVALSKHFCIQNKVGCSGDPVAGSTTPLSESGAWSVLQSRVFPSFELKKFESQAHTFCRELRQSLAGRDTR
jgi:HD-like signal output (HDOD) protein